MQIKATIYPILPEPCEFCSSGMAWMKCHDDRLRCNNCVHKYANEVGFDKWEKPGEKAPTPLQAAVYDGGKVVVYEQPKLI